MRYGVEFTEQAEAEAYEAYAWIAEESPANAARWYHGLLEAINSLVSMPKRCGLAPEDEVFEEDIRQLLYGKYRVLFQVVGQTVYVLHIRHGARKTIDPQEQKDEEQ